MQSKYKNPDKFIYQLKNEISYRDDLIKKRDGEIEHLKKDILDLTRSVLGDKMFDWKDPEKVVHVAQPLEMNKVNQMTVGSTIYMRGTVIKRTVSRYESENEVVMNFSTVFLKK